MSPATVAASRRAPPSAPPVPAPASALRRLAGALLVALAVLPLFRLLPARQTGIAGEVVAMVLEVYWDFLLAGALLALVPLLVCGRFLAPAAVERGVARARDWLLAPALPRFALALALLAVLATAAFTLFVLDGRPSIIDAMAQLLQARYWSAGRLAGPPDALNEFWHIQNSLLTERGWVSQYPPGHVALLALGFRLGAVWLVGPLLAGVAVLFLTLAAARLLPERPATARLAGLLLALSTYFLCLSGSFLNHVAGAALFAVALYCAVRARDGRAPWAAGAGAALAYAFAVRPVSAIVAGLTFAFALWLPSLRGDALRGFARRAALGVAGGLPFLAAFLAYNAHFFGHPLRLGYRVALGPAMGLGFHRDPWGNVYGPVEALAYTGSDLLTLGVNLLETPISATLVIGLWLLLARTVPRGARVFLLWAFGAVAANALYWHHGIYMGPRMLLESAPAWAALAALAATGLVERTPARPLLGGRFSARSALAGGFTATLLFGVLYLGPQRARSYGGDFIPLARIEPPRPAGAALVFVHDAWISRIGMRLAVAGMSLDSVETAVRQNPTCRVHALATRIATMSELERAGLVSRLDMEPRESGLPEEVILAPGDKIRVAPGERLAGQCLREARSDRNGILDVAPFLWQGDLPGLPGDGPLYVRDLGPEANRAALRTWPERTPWVFSTPSVVAAPELVDYATGMRALWGDVEGSVPR